MGGKMLVFGATVTFEKNTDMNLYYQIREAYLLCPNQTRFYR